MMKIMSITVCLMLLQIFATAARMFGEDLLKHPKTYSEKLEEMFSYRETGVFSPNSMINTVILENGYAKSSIINKDAWEPDIKGRIVKRVDIIFTKYPVNKEDWITNYHELLVDRLIELFSIDPSLNDAAIEWNLLLQTDCKKAWEAKQFFHGILIVYENIPHQVPKIPEQKTEREYVGDVGDRQVDSISVHVIPNTSETLNIPKFEKQKKNRKSKKPKLKNLPDCPNFNRKRIFGIF